MPQRSSDFEVAKRFVDIIAELSEVLATNSDEWGELPYSVEFATAMLAAQHDLGMDDEQIASAAFGMAVMFRFVEKWGIDGHTETGDRYEGEAPVVDNNDNGDSGPEQRSGEEAGRSGLRNRRGRNRKKDSEQSGVVTGEGSQ